MTTNTSTAEISEIAQAKAILAEAPEMLEEFISSCKTVGYSELAELLQTAKNKVDAEITYGVWSDARNPEELLIEAEEKEALQDELADACIEAAGDHENVHPLVKHS